MDIRVGTAADVETLLALFDDAVAWLVARGQAGQWGEQPFSARLATVASARDWAGDGGLRLAFADADDGDREAIGAIVLGEHNDYVPPLDRPELYVQVLLTSSRHRGEGVGAALVERAADEARAAGAEVLRVDCWAGVPELAAHYERLGFHRTGTFDVDGWPGAILERELG